MNYKILSTIYFILTLFQNLSLAQNNKGYNVCTPELMDCSVFGFGKRVTACMDCTEPIEDSCGQDLSTCFESTPQFCTGPCKPLAKGARLL